MTPLIPKDWRARRGCEPRTGRIYVEHMPHEDPSCRWQVSDAAYAVCVGFRTKREATEAASFYRAYIKRHGDIDLCSVPWSLDDELHYDDPERYERWWAVEYPPKAAA